MKKATLLFSLFAVLGITLTGCNKDDDEEFKREPMEPYAFAKFETNDKISVSLEEGVGVTVNNEEKKAITKNIFTDGSFDHKTAKFYTPDPLGKSLRNDEKGEFSLSDSSVESLLDRDYYWDGESKVYTAMFFSLSFKHTFVENEGNLGLYLNTSILDGIAKSRFELVKSKEIAPKAEKSFRVCLLSNGDEDLNTRVLALFRDKNACTHLDGSIRSGWSEENHFGGVSYENDLIDKNYHEDLPTVGTLDSYTNRLDYLGKFDSSKQDENGEVELKYTVVCWYEGTDTSCVNDNFTGDSAMAHLSFEGITLPAL